MRIVVVFTLDGCVHCTNLKKRLNEENIEFLEIEITENPEIWGQVYKQTKNDYLPTVFVKNENSNSGPIFIPTVDFNDEDELIKKLKQYLEKGD